MAPLPEYPRLGGTSEVRLTREWSAPAWSGTGERMLAIQREVESALARAYDDAVRDLPEDGPESAARARTLGEALRLNVHATGSQGRLARSGDLAAIFAETDISEIQSLQMSGGNEDRLPCIRLRLFNDPTNRDPALSLSVSGPDRQWVSGVADLLVGELRKGVPWWGYMRHPSVLIPIFAVLTFFALMLTMLYGSWYWSNQAVIYFAFVAAVLSVPMSRSAPGTIVRTLFPGFEILGPGATAAGKQVLGSFLAVASFSLAVAGVVFGIMAL